MKDIKKGAFTRRLSVGLAGAKGGLGLLQAKASSLLLPKDQQKAHNDQALAHEARKFVAHLGELKGAYVKIGQMLALYGEHILPQQVTEALHTLEASTAAIDWAQIEPAIYAELGKRAAIDLDISPEAMAAASLAQVHRCGRVIDGLPVCIKIQYPGIGDTIEDDFKNVIQMLSLGRWIKSGRQMDALIKEIKHFLVKEVDYQHELDTANRVRIYLDADDRYKTPSYFSELCSSRVLTMEFIEGHDVTSQEVQALSQERRDKLAEAMLELFFKEAFEWRLMQTDPNFGNYRIEIGEQSDKLVLLDFGAVHDLSESFSQALQRTILAAQDQNMSDVVEGLIELNCLRSSDSQAVKQSFAQFCLYILEPFRQSFDGVPEGVVENRKYDWQNSRLLKRAGKLGSKGVLIKGFTVPPPEFMLIVRKLTGVFTFVSTIGAKTYSAHLLDSYRVAKQ